MNTRKKASKITRSQSKKSNCKYLPPKNVFCQSAKLFFLIIIYYTGFYSITVNPSYLSLVHLEWLFFSVLMNRQAKKSHQQNEENNISSLQSARSNPYLIILHRKQN